MSEVEGFLGIGDFVDAQRPVSTSLLQQIAANVTAATSQLLPRSSFSFDARRPLLLHGSPYRLMSPPFLLRTRPTDTHVKIAVDCDCVSADVTVWAMVLGEEGMEGVGGSALQAETTISVGTDQQIELTVQIPSRVRRSGRPVEVVLVAESEEDSGGDLTVAPTGSDQATHRWVFLDNGVAGWSNSLIYRLIIDAAGTAPDEDRLPGDRLVMGRQTTGSGDYVFVWPHYTQEEILEWAYTQVIDYLGKYDWTLRPIGYLKIYTVGLRASATVSPALSLVPYAGGRRLSAGWLRKIAAAQETAWRTLSPQIHQGITDPWRADPAGASAPYDGSGQRLLMPAGTIWHYPSAVGAPSWRVVGACTAGPCLEGEDSAGAAFYRKVYEIHGLFVAFQQDQTDQMRQVTLRARLRDSDSTDPTSTSEEMAVEFEAHRLVRWDARPTNFAAAGLFWRTFDRSAGIDVYQSPMSSLIPWELALERGGLRLYRFALTIEEDAAEVGDTERLLTLEMKGPQDESTPEGRAFFRRRSKCWVWIPNFCVTVRREEMR